MKEDKRKTRKHFPPYGWELVMKNCALCDKLVMLHPSKNVCKECVEGLAENFAKKS